VSRPTGPSRWWALSIGVVLLATFSVLITGTASAHDGLSSVIYLDIYPDGTVAGQVEHPIVLLNDFFGFELDPDSSTASDIDAIQDVMIPFNTESLVIVTGSGEPWPIAFSDTEIVATENRLYVGFNFELEGAFDNVPRVFDVTYRGIFEDRAGHSGFVVIRTDPQTGVFLNEGNFQPDVLTSADPTSSVNLDAPNRVKALKGTIGLGMEHIFIGNDHILFVLVLMLPAVMLFSPSRSWEPTPSIRAGLWRVFKIATMFTVAHSITLTLGGLRIVELPSRLVETAIALSIVAAAMHNLRPVFANKEHLIAFAFGIFHGFGFAGLLSDLGIGRGERLASLFGFNLGVEIGQAFIILILFPTLYLLRRTMLYPWIIRVGSSVLASVAGLWAIERVVGTSLGVDNFIEKFTRSPRVFVLISISTAVAAAVVSVERRRGRLAPIGRSTNHVPASDRFEPQIGGIDPKRAGLAHLGRYAAVGGAALLTTFYIYLALGLTPEWWPDRSFGPRAADVHWKLSVATGSTAMILLGTTLAIGPIRNIRRGKRGPIHIPWRRVTGVWTAVAAWTHLVFGITIHADGARIWVPFTHLWQSQGKLRLLAVAMFIGLGAASILALLAATSNSRSIRAIGARRWKVLQRSAYLVGALVVLHVLAVQVQESRDLRHVAITASVLFAFASIQVAGFLYTWRLGSQRRVTPSSATHHSEAAGPVEDHQIATPEDG